MDEPMEISISGDAGSAFREHFDIDSAAQAREALANADSLFHNTSHPWAGLDGRAPDRETFDYAVNAVNDRFARGVYKDGELEERRKRQEEAEEEARSGTSRHVANETNDWKAVCTAPDYCRVGKDVVPFDTYADIGNEVLASPDVKAQGTPVYRTGDLHQGVQGDAGSGVVSGTSQGSGHVRFDTGQNNVLVNGRPVIRQDSACTINCNAAGVGGAPGKVVTTQTGAQSNGDGRGEPNEAMQALLDAEADERSFWQKTKDLGSGLVEGAKRLGSASAADPLDTGVGVLKGLGNLPTDLWNLGIMGSKYVGPGVSVATVAGGMEKAAMQAYKAGDVARANALAGRANELMNAGYADDLFELTSDAQRGGAILSMVVPVGGIVKGVGTGAKAIRGADAIADVAKGTRAVDAAADAAKGVDAAADAAKGVDGAADAARVAGHAGDAGDVARGADVAADASKTPSSSGAREGVHVQPKRKPPPDDWKTYETHGIKDSPLDSEEGRKLIDAYKSQGMTDEQALERASELMRSGSNLPKEIAFAEGERFYKLVPEGQMPGKYSPYWMKESEIASVQGLSRDQIANRFGLPLESQQAARFELVEIQATRGGSVFESTVAGTSQNGWVQAGGGTQSLITNRSIFTDPVSTGRKFP